MSDYTRQAAKLLGEQVDAIRAGGETDPETLDEIVALLMKAADDYLLHVVDDGAGLYLARGGAVVHTFLGDVTPETAEKVCSIVRLVEHHPDALRWALGQVTGRRLTLHPEETFPGRAALRLLTLLGGVEGLTLLERLDTGPL